MKEIKFLNCKFEWWAWWYAEMYVRDVGYNAPLYKGKSHSKLYSAPNTDYQVKIWQTKTLVKVEVIR